MQLWCLGFFYPVAFCSLNHGFLFRHIAQVVQKSAEWALLFRAAQDTAHPKCIVSPDPSGLRLETSVRRQNCLSYWEKSTKRALLIHHSYWAGNVAVLVLQRLEGLPAQVPLGYHIKAVGWKTSRAAGQTHFWNEQLCLESLFSLFTLQRWREYSRWGSRSVTHIICSGGTLTFLFSAMKAPSWWKLNFYLPHCRGLSYTCI